MIVGLLLAAGRARRFGSQKLLAPLDGEPLVRHAARRIAADTDAAVAVVGCDAPAVAAALGGLGFTIVENPDWAHGMGTSLARAVAALPAATDAVVVVLGDQPGIAPDAIGAAIAEWRRGGHAIVATRYRGARGHPVLLDRAVLPELRGLDGDAGARVVMDARPERVAYVDVDREPPRDVDTPDDLARTGG